MENFVLNLESDSSDNLYLRIYNTIRSEILNGDLASGTKLPSLRKLAESNFVSVTTVEAAYEQLLVEGYIESRPKSGYYVTDARYDTLVSGDLKDEAVADSQASVSPQGGRSIAAQTRPEIYDAESFDFAKWKKCMNRVFNECEHLLQTEADVKGEPALRQEIARYLYQSRGVKCTPEQIVIGAGTQQLTNTLSKILREIGIREAATETPGYGSIREILKDEGFPVNEIPVEKNGIVIEKLPQGVKTIVYVNPSNQFPTGSVMPVGRRYELIRWAGENDSYILEDDYDAELRYRGKPIPAMQGLDAGGRVIYLGSFSSTLYAAIRISYLVLPEALAEIFDRNSSRYSQTCSKAEQLCLAFYMEQGDYYRHIKKLRRHYAAKLSTVMDVLSGCDSNVLEAIDSQSGIAIMLKLHTTANVDEICAIAHGQGLEMRPVKDLCTEDCQIVYFYFYRVPEGLLKLLIKQFVNKIAR